MKKLLVSLVAALTLASCAVLSFGPKTLDVVEANGWQVTTFDKKCDDRDILALATMSGAEQAQLEQMKSAEVKKGEVVIKACVYYYHGTKNFIIVDAEGGVGVLSAEKP